MSQFEIMDTEIFAKVEGGFGGYGKYVLGYPGDYLDITNHRVVSAKTFHKSYQILEND